MHNFKFNQSRDLRRKWSFDVKGFQKYKKVIVVGTGQTGYMAHNLIFNSNDRCFTHTKYMISSGDAFNTLGNKYSAVKNNW